MVSTSKMFLNLVQMCYECCGWPLMLLRFKNANYKTVYKQICLQSLHLTLADNFIKRHRENVFQTVELGSNNKQWLSILCHSTSQLELLVLRENNLKTVRPRFFTLSLISSRFLYLSQLNVQF